MSAQQVARILSVAFASFALASPIAVADGVDRDPHRHDDDHVSVLEEIYSNFGCISGLDSVEQ